MERILPFQKNNDDAQAWEELKTLVNFRIEAAEAGAISTKTMREIAEDKLKQLGAT